MPFLQRPSSCQWLSAGQVGQVFIKMHGSEATLKNLEVFSNDMSSSRATFSLLSGLWGSSWQIFNLRSCWHGGAPVSASAQDRQRKGWLRHWKRFRLCRKFQYWTASRSIKTIEKSWEINQNSEGLFLAMSCYFRSTHLKPYEIPTFLNHIKTISKQHPKL